MQEKDKFIEHPFEIKKDAKGRPIPPEFVDADVPTEPVAQEMIAPEGQLSIESSDQVDQPEESIGSPEDPVDEQPKSRKHFPAKEVNIRRMREELEKERAEREIMARELEFYRRGQNQQQAAPQHDHAQEDDSDLNIGDEDLVEGKHLKKIINQMQSKINQAQQYSHQQAQVAHQSALEVQLKAQYPDFDQVVTTDNLKDLSAAYPELSSSISSTSDLRSKAISAYTMIKNLGIYQDPGLYSDDKNRIKRNAAKPRPASSAAPTHSSPLSQAGAYANGLTPALKAALYKEMEECRLK